MAISVSPELLALADRVPLAVDWEVAVRAPLAFSCRLIQACWLHPGFRRRGWKPLRHRVTWLRPDGEEMLDRDWQGARVLTALLDGECLITVNAGSAPVEVTLPAAHLGRAWRCICTTATGFTDGARSRAALDALTLQPRSLAAFVRDDGAP
jgi:hypothetical protein